MSQIKHVNQTLKRLLKQHQLTYKDVAHALNMSEANIKRIFATQSFTLERLEEICQLIHINLSDLFLLAEKQTEQLSQLTLNQEQELIDDPKLFLVAVCVRDGWQFDEMISQYQISQHECIQLLAKLDKLKMIDLLPNNHYKLRIAQDFRWIPSGPLAKFMEREVISTFMADKFDQPNCFRFYLRGSYSSSSLAIIERKLNQLTKEVALLNQEDAQLPLAKRQHVGLLMAMRPWQISFFEQLKRTQPD